MIRAKRVGRAPFHLSAISSLIAVLIPAASESSCETANCETDHSAWEGNSTEEIHLLIGLVVLVKCQP